MRRILGIILISIPILLLTVATIVLLLDSISRIGAIIGIFMAGCVILGGYLYETG